jgi:amino acid transporter
MLQQRLRLLQAVSLNMSMMVGIGPFITIPTLLGTLGGPQAMIGWVVGAVVALTDGLVWSELAAAFPGSGGTYHFFDAVYGETRLGRLLKFLFVWQFVFSGPLEVATGAIGVVQYLGYFYPSLRYSAWNWSQLMPWEDQDAARALGVIAGGMAALPWGAWNVAWGQVGAMGVMALVTLLAYRRIAMAGRLMVVLWVGMLLTVAWVILAGLTHFDSLKAFDFPKGAWQIDGRWMAGLGMALGIAMYDFLGYYQVCYLGEEVEDAPRTIPRSILISVITISLVYLTMNIGIIGVLPWRDVIESEHVASDLMLRVHGARAAELATLMIVWTAMASTFAALLSYSRVPYAAARAGHFFRTFAATHPTGQFPHRSLLLVSGLATLACLADLGTVIAALLASRILIQFVGQIVTVIYLRLRPGGLASPFRMPLFPLPALLALAGWLFVFGTSKESVLIYGVGSLLVGAAAFIVWDFLAARRPHRANPAGPAP